MLRSNLRRYNLRPGLSLQFLCFATDHAAECRIEADQSSIGGNKADSDARRLKRRAKQVIHIAHDAHCTGLSVRRK
ncbi:MAG: hypothetical protein NT042_09180 [Sulfuritalea sp.]|nr:hypothetical protein [Sulfuritalea sp.]